jgi:hypothetical protein
MLAPVDHLPSSLDDERSRFVETAPILQRDAEVLSAALLADARPLVVCRGEMQGEVVATAGRVEEQDAPVLKANLPPEHLLVERHRSGVFRYQQVDVPNSPRLDCHLASPKSRCLQPRFAHDGTLILALAASVVAVPLAVVGGSALLNTVQAGIGIGPLSAPVPVLAFAVGPAVLVVAFIGALGPAWSASRTSLTAVLREL